MAEFRARMGRNASPYDKPRVYFVCHPADFSTHFDKICDDVLENLDCAIYYTPDMTEPHEEAAMDADLGRMSLFLVPVTFRLMSEENRAMSVDIAYAKKNHIPILPFIMESDIDEVYALPENFGERQYLSPFSLDTTEVSYREKLKKHLESVFGGEEMANRVRAAFDTYVFLSYRKKDRLYANELMKRIHAIPGCRDIAIWYDEYLIPGERWNENIKRAMQMVKEKSNLFALLVTPNLLEEYTDANGVERKNYVMETEYPDARTLGMNIIPTEMVETDHDVLRVKYEDIPDCIYPGDEQFNDIMQRTFSDFVASDRSGTPEHCYLIGLAYLDGIDVEVNAALGVELITKAAEDGYEEAMEKLYTMYRDGGRVPSDCREALKWAVRLADYSAGKYGENDLKTVDRQETLASAYLACGQYGDALRAGRRVYKYRMKAYGAADLRTINIMQTLALIHQEGGDPEKAIEYNHRLYEILQDAFQGENAVINEKWYAVINNIASACADAGKLDMAIKLQKQLVETSSQYYGAVDANVTMFMNNLAAFYGKRTDRASLLTALDMHKKVYKAFCEIYHEEHPHALKSLLNVATVYGRLDNGGRALKLKQQVYDTCCRVFGETHPLTLHSLNNLAHTCGKHGDPHQALVLKERSYQLHCEVYGAIHPRTLIAHANLAFSLCNTGDPERAFRIARSIYLLCEKKLGKNHQSSITMAQIYQSLKKYYK